MIPDRALEALRSLREASAPTLVLYPEPGPPEPRSVALVPGSFDPMTIAHAALVERALDRAHLLALVYSVRTLPKEGPAHRPSLFAEENRVAVLDAYRRGHDRVAIGLSSHGLLADQVGAARARFPRAELSLVMGSDKFAQLLDPKWYPDRTATLQALFAEARVLFATRAGEETMVEHLLGLPEHAEWRGRIESLAIPKEVAAVSSRRVRDLVAQGMDPLPMVPAEARATVKRLLSVSGR